MTTMTAAEKWGPGPWASEPDRDQWTDPTTGLKCLARRHGFTGHWCGYVAIPEGHPWHQVEYTDLPSIEVHWGVNYSDHMEGESGWWVGFDCAHLGDLSPHEIVNDDYGLREGVYRDLRFVRSECTRLAEQINEAHQ